MAFDFYFAGSQAQETEDLMVKLNANVLKSYINDRSNIVKWFRYKDMGWTGKLLIDNGAFTVHRKGGKLDIDKYIEWLNENDKYIDYAIALDDIPGKWGEVKTSEQVKLSPVRTWENYLYMLTKVKSPQKLLPVFHMGENFNYLTSMLNSGLISSNYICLSGNKELTNKQREDWYSKCFYLIKQSNMPTVRVHCLGSATIQNAEKFPFTSMDATSWIMTGANGSILTDYGIIYVSSSGDNLKDYVYNLPSDAVQKIIDYCKKYDMSLSDITQDYRARMLMNIHYLYDKSKSCKDASYNIGKRRLF